MTKNNGEAGAGPARYVTLSHPDFNRRPRSYTGSADLQTGRSEALAGFQPKLIYRRWGISPRPENKPAYYNAVKKSGQRTKCAIGLPFNGFAYFRFILSEYRITLKETLPLPGSRYD